MNLPLETRELKKLLSGLDKQLGIHSMLNLVLSSGMCTDDVLNIRLENLKYESNTILIYDKYLGRTRTVPLPARVMKLINEYQNGHDNPKMKLYEVSEPIINNRLSNLAQDRLKHPISWSGIRHTWAQMAFKRDVSLRSMQETSGASLEQLAKWSLYKKPETDIDSTADLLKEFY